MSDLQKLTVHEIQLEKLCLGVQQQLSRHMLDVDVRHFSDWLIDSFVIHVTGYVWAQQKYLTIEYPADWWQAVKERWFPDWLVDRYPIKYTIHNINCQAKFPELKYVPDRLGPAVFHIIDEVSLEAHHET